MSLKSLRIQKGFLVVALFLFAALVFQRDTDRVWPIPEWGLWVTMMISCFIGYVFGKLFQMLEND